MKILARFESVEPCGSLYKYEIRENQCMYLVHNGKQKVNKMIVLEGMASVEPISRFTAHRNQEVCLRHPHKNESNFQEMKDLIYSKISSSGLGSTFEEFFTMPRIVYATKFFVSNVYTRGKDVPLEGILRIRDLGGEYVDVPPGMVSSIENQKAYSDTDNSCSLTIHRSEIKGEMKRVAL